MIGYMPRGPNMAKSLGIVSNAKEGLSYFSLHKPTDSYMAIHLDSGNAACLQTGWPCQAEKASSTAATIKSKAR